MKYQLEVGRHGDNWKEVGDEYPRDQTDLEAWKEIGENQETYEGKYHFRIVDENGKVVWTKTPPYEGIWVNLAEEPQIWLEEIREDYGINEELFRIACRAWLEHHAHW